MVKIAGANGATLAVWGELVWPFVVTVNVVACPATSHGTCTIACPDVTTYNGAGYLLENCMDRPDSVVGQGMPEATVIEFNRNVPKTEARLPGATTAPKLAPLTTPPELIDGTG